MILPVLNEAQALPGALGRMPSGLDRFVVANASTDGSDAVAARLGGRLVKEPPQANR